MVKQNNLTILQLIYVFIKDRLKNTSFALSIISMKFYLTYIRPGLLSFPWSFLCLYAALTFEIDIYIHRIWQYQELFVYYK